MSRREKSSGGGTLPSAPLRQVLSVIGANAHTNASGMTAAQIVSALQSSSTTWDSSTTITVYAGGKRDARNGARHPWLNGATEAAPNAAVNAATSDISQHGAKAAAVDSGVRLLRRNRQLVLQRSIASVSCSMARR